MTHIQEHLDEALDLEELARVACFSSFHFHRVFAAMTGETIADHVRRLRLLQTIAGGDYAVAKNCPVGKIKDAFQFLYGKWLARSSRELRPAPSFLLMAA
jgi:AraC family transcriptional regulator